MDASSWLGLTSSFRISRYHPVLHLFQFHVLPVRPGWSGASPMKLGTDQKRIAGQEGDMKTGRLRGYLTRLHFEIQCALWATLLTGVLFFVVLVAPDIPAIQQRTTAAEAAQFLSQCSQYCEKWGLPRGSLRHSECMQDLKQFRADIEAKMGDELLP